MTRSAVAAVAATLAGLGVASAAPTSDRAAILKLKNEVRQQSERLSKLEDVIEPGGPIRLRIGKLEREATGVQQALNTPTVIKVVAKQTIPANGAATVHALCPEGDQVLSGGFIHGALNGVVTRAVPIQKPSPGFEVQVLEVPGIATGNQDARLTVVAYCAPYSTDVDAHPIAPVVLGSEVPAQ
jgi:hypothetical protein